MGREFREEGGEKPGNPSSLKNYFKKWMIKN